MHEVNRKPLPLFKSRIPAWFFLLLFFCFFEQPVTGFGKNYPRYQKPDFLTFEELKQLTVNPHPGGGLEKKLDRFWTSPVISNEAYYQGYRPRLLQSSKLGPFLRVASWNIEKSIYIRDVIRFLKSPRTCRRMIDPGKAAADSAVHQKILQQRQKLLTADILILQEMDIGIKRSGYLDAARALAKSLHMNYAYGVEYLEIDPVLLGLENIEYDEGGGVDQTATDYFAVDSKRYHGAFGCAVLSRYPIKHVEVLPLKNQGYDWYWGEKRKTTFLENARRFGTKTLFENELTREMKAGGRIYFRVDLDVPELPSGTLSIINIHLEIKCQPKNRQAQVVEILSHIGGIKNPVIMMGDFNSAPQDLSPTSVTRTVKRAAKDPTHWFSLAVNAVSPHALSLNVSRVLSNITKNFQDPTARHIPVLAPNPVKGLFRIIEEFEFDDGAVFDFRGDSRHSLNGKEGTLANSNQRDQKGFKTTFSVKRPIGPLIGKYRLDWAFVKSYLFNDPRDASGSYRFAPHFGETLEEMNTHLLTPLSDHHPNVIDLPFEESPAATGHRD